MLRTLVSSAVGRPCILAAQYAGKDITWTFLVNEFKADSAGQ